jgi:transcriptional regulator GlxA family with amidase domain
MEQQNAPKPRHGYAAAVCCKRETASFLSSEVLPVPGEAINTTLPGCRSVSTRDDALHRESNLLVEPPARRSDAKVTSAHVVFSASGVVSWLRRQHARGAKLVSVCSGAFILAETGLAAGRSVSTHSICAEALAERFPDITVDTNRRIIDHGDIITAGGGSWPGSTLACFS